MEYLYGVLAEGLPFYLLEARQVHPDQLNVLHYLLHAAVDINLLGKRLRIRSQHMLRLLLRSRIIEEIPAERGPHRIQLLPLVIKLQRVLVVLLPLILQHPLLVFHPLLDINVDCVADAFLAFEAFEQDRVLDILEHVVINILQHLHRIEPLVLVLLIEVALPDPVAAVLLPLRFVQSRLLLRFREQILLILLLLFFLQLFGLYLI